MRRTPLALPLAFVAFLGACLPGSGPPLLTYEEAGAPSPPDFTAGDGGGRVDVDLGDPFGVDGVTPSHGSWRGGTRAVLHGRGFSSQLVVTLGSARLDASSVLASDPTRAAIVTPEGVPGPVDVRVENPGSADARVLPAGFVYDPFYVTPEVGTTTGGTRIALVGSTTAGAPSFVPGSAVTVGGKPCTDVLVVSPSRLECTTPANPLGPTDVNVAPPTGAPLAARDAFTYADGVDGNRGGLSGGTLAGTLHVHALDAWTGTPIAGALAIVGGAPNAAVLTTDTAGSATFSGTNGAVTVTVAAKCHQPMTFVDVPVDTVTVYLNPVYDISCATQGDPPSSGAGGGFIDAGEVDGELVWPSGIEFKRGGWTNVPAAVRPSERVAAYVFFASGSATYPFQLPSASSAVTLAAPGGIGYAYTAPVPPGNITLYALAGIEDRTASPPTFTAYAMGVARGVSVPPGTRVQQVDIPMSIVLDHQVTVTPTPPARSDRGPDRMTGRVAVTLGSSGYALLPSGVATALLPSTGSLVFGGLPSLDHALAGESYVVSATAGTGPYLGYPLSVLAGVRTSDANNPVGLGGFLGVPTLGQPAALPWGGTHVTFTSPSTFDLAVVSIDSGNGLVRWTIAVPTGRTDFALPDLSSYGGLAGGSVGLVSGTIRTYVYVGRLDGFSYASLKLGNLNGGTWNAYAADTLEGSY